MANNVTMPNRGYIYVKKESTYDTALTVATTDRLYVENLSVSLEQDDNPRSGISTGHPGGWMSDPGVKRLPYSFDCDIRMATIASANDADAPNVDPLLQVPFTRVSNSTDKTHTYFLAPFNHGSNWIQMGSIDTVNTDSNVWVLPGCRHAMTFQFTPGLPMRISVSGEGLYSSNASVANGSGAPTLTYPSDKPMIARASTAKVIDLSDDSLYGGGTLGTPTNTVKIRDLSLDLGFSVTGDPAISGTSGLGRIRIVPGQVVWNMEVEQVDVDDWDPYTLRDGAQALELNFVFAQPGAAGNTMQVVGYGQIVGSISEQVADNGLKTWGLTIHGRYPTDASAAGAPPADPAVGVRPLQAIVAGTNKGLGIDTTITPLSGLVAIQFQTV